MIALLGPVWWYDMVRTSRRISLLILRSIYPLVLFSVLAVMYAQVIQEDYFTGPELNPNALATLAYSFFTSFMVIQWVAVLVLTPIYVGSAIADEKDRRTLEYLFTTDLRNREIVLGKLMSRLAVLLLILLAGLPLLSIIQLFGGVPTDLLWSGFAATVLTMLSLSGVSMYWSVHCRSAREAILLVFLTVLLYFVVYLVALVAWIGFTERAVRLPSVNSSDPLALVELGLWCLISGNPFHALYDLAVAISRPGGGSYGSTLVAWLIRYAVFHGLIFLFFIGLAVLRVRSAYMQQACAATKKTDHPSRGLASEGCASVDSEPMVWKELVTDGGYRLGRVGKVLSGLFAFLVLLLAVLMFILRIANAMNLYGFLETFAAFSIIVILPSIMGTLVLRGTWRIGWIIICTAIIGILLYAATIVTDSPAWWNPKSPRIDIVPELARVFLALYAALIWLVTAIRASYSINIEREKQTLDSLLATLLTEREIIYGKWLGSMAYARWLVGILLIVWFFDVCSGVLHPLGLLASAAAFIIFLGLFTSIGLFCGTIVRSSLGAGLLTTLVTLFVLGGHYFITGPLLIVFTANAGPSGDYIIMPFLSITPTLVMVFAHLNGWELDLSGPQPVADGRLYMAACCIGATLLWAVVAYLLYESAIERFRTRCGRITLARPRLPRQSALTPSTRNAIVGLGIPSKPS
ncbi:MAG: ABC transporter permease subunit [Gemmatales bacterium]|nr:ABC transporter permease subunit [Gemmatales bacterium]MDW8388349.1 ABC transporter permease subunit [Gemmatales bacterium]